MTGTRLLTQRSLRAGLGNRQVVSVASLECYRRRESTVEGASPPRDLRKLLSGKNVKSKS